MSLAQLGPLSTAAAVALCIIMTGAWMIQRRTGNSGWIDVIWSLGTGATAVTLALLPLQPDWPHWRQIAVACLAAAWCLRLGLHIGSRTRGVTDDPRYRALIEEWGADAARRLFLFLQAQAAVGIVLAVAVAAAAHNSNPALRAQDLIGLLLLVAAIAGEATADRQLRAFKADPGNRGKVCDIGLWAWSRHPNYFFEWLSWVAYPVIAIDLAGHNPYGWIALAAPAVMYWVLVHASGIPPLEAHMLRSRGDAFRDYQRRTSAFFPLPPKKR